MPPKLRFVLIFLFGFFSHFVQSQCDSGTIQSTIKGRDTLLIKELIKKIEHCPELRDSLGYAYHELGLAYYFKRNYRKAIEATAKALEILKQELGSEDVHIAKTSYNLGAFYKKNEEYGNSAIHYRVAFNIYQKHGEPKVVSSSRDLADVYQRIGDYDLAEDYIEIAIQMSSLFKDTVNLATCYLNYGIILNSTKQFNRAIEFLNNGIRIYEKTPNKSMSSKMWINKAACYLNKAYSFRYLKNYKQSLESFKQSLRVTKLLQNPSSEILIYNNIGNQYRLLRDFPKAIENLNNALKLSQQNNFYQHKAKVYDNYGEVYLDQKNFPQALSHFHKAIQSIIPDFDNEDYHSSPSEEQLKQVSTKTELLTILGDKARAWKKWYEATENQEYLEQALENYKLADKVIDLMRNDHLAQGSKLFWREATHSIYEAALDVCFLGGYWEDAFYFFEKSKSILLLDNLTALGARQFLTTELENEEVQLQKAVFNAQQALENARKEAQTEFRAHLVNAQESYEDFLSNLEKTHPQYHAFRYQSDVLGVKEARAHLLNDTTHLIHYFYGDSSIYVLRLGKERFDFEKIKRIPDLDELIEKYLEHFSSRNVTQNNPGSYAKVAHALFNAIYAPVWKSRDLNGEVIIIPDGVLGFVPFESLIYEESNSSNPGRFNYIINEQLLYTGYSATVLQKQLEFLKDRPSKQKVLGLAPFENHSTSKFDLLKYSRKELEACGGKLFFNEGATLDIFHQYALDYQVFHLATHASSAGNSDKAYIAFADTNLVLSDLYALQLPANLVILSGCKTGLGKVYTGEGMMSLARGFTYSGTAGLISSLWNLNDRATSDIFKSFYEYVQTGKSVAEALRLSKKGFIEEADESKRTPYYWAGLTLIGPDQKLDLKSDSGFLKGTKAVWLAVGLAFLFFIWYRSRMRKEADEIQNA